MNTYREREEEAYKLILNKLDIETFSVGKKAIISTGKGTEEEHEDLIMAILVLQTKLFELGLRIGTSMVNDENARLMVSKKFYTEATRLLDKVFNIHAELLIDDNFMAYKVQVSEPL